MEARWVKEKNKYYFEYKNHIKADLRSKFITHYEITSKEVHDRNALKQLINKDDIGR